MKLADLGRRLPPLRIRVRLSLWYMASIVPMLLIYALVTAWFVHQHMRNEIDARLKLDLSTAVDRHLLQWGGLPPNTTIEWLESTDPHQAYIDSWHINPHNSALSLHQRIHGTRTDLPTPEDERPDGEPFNSRLNDGSPWRMVQGHALLGDTTLLIRAALPLAPLHQLMWDMLTGSGLGVLAVLLIASAGGLWIAGAALQPITLVIQRARRIGPKSLSARLPVSRTRDELSELSEVINDLLGRVQGAMLRQGRFATEAAHELRTPLTAQRSVGELALSREASVGELRHAVASMLEEGHHMQKVIDGLLTLARADTGRLVAQLAPIDLADLLEQTVPSLLPLAEERAQTLSWRGEPAVRAQADEALLRQVLLNLVHNAITHCGPGTRISVRLSTTATEAVLSIIDNGPGMPRPQRNDEMFHRRPRSHASVRGLGLGLSIAKALVRAQGASMHINSQPRCGTRIDIQLPRVAPDKPGPLPADPAQQEGKESHLYRPSLAPGGRL